MSNTKLQSQLTDLKVSNMYNTNKYKNLNNTEVYNETGTSLGASSSSPKTYTKVIEKMLYK